MRPSRTLTAALTLMLGHALAGANCTISRPPYSVYTYASTLKDDPAKATRITTVKYAPIQSGLRVVTTSGANTVVSEITCKNGKLSTSVQNVSVIPFHLRNETKNQEIKWQVGFTWITTSKTSLTDKGTWETTAKNTIQKIEQLKTPAGIFKVYRIETTFTAKFGDDVETIPDLQVIWYSKELGIIQNTFQGNTSTLIKLAK